MKNDVTNLKSAGSLDGISIPTIKPVSTYASFNARNDGYTHDTHIADEVTKEDGAHGSDQVLSGITRLCSSASRRRGQT